MHTPHTSTPPICVLYHPHPLSCPQWQTACIFLFIIYLCCSYYYRICSILCYFLLLSSIVLFTLSLCVLFIINLFYAHVLQIPTQHSDGCNPLLLSTALEAMSTGASVLTSLSLIQNKPSFILCLSLTLHSGQQNTLGL